MALSDADMKNIKILFKSTLDEDDSLVRKDDIKHLPDKDAFFEQTLKVLEKLDSLEESMDLITSTQSDHTDRIEVLEKIHPKGIHSVVA